MVVETTLACPFCSKQIDPRDYFCPNCGKKVREKPVSTGFWGLAALFGVSLLAPPFGLGLTMRYVKSADQKAKTMGWISLVLTISTLVIFSWWGIVWAQNVSKRVSESLKQYQNLGL